MRCDCRRERRARDHEGKHEQRRYDQRVGHAKACEPTRFGPGPCPAWRRARGHTELPHGRQAHGWWPGGSLEEHVRKRARWRACKLIDGRLHRVPFEMTRRVRGSIKVYERSTNELTTTYATEEIRIAPCTTGRSFCPMASTVARPIPWRAKRVSMMTAFESDSPINTPSSVTVEVSALRSTWT